MASVRVGVEVVGRWRRRGGTNPLASAPLLIGLRVRVCGGAVGTVNVGSRAPACLTFYMALREGGGHCHKRQAPPIRVRLGSRNRSGDPFGEITFLTANALTLDTLLSGSFQPAVQFLSVLASASAIW
jgi:hypothetical protein